MPQEWDLAFDWLFGPLLETARHRLPPSLKAEAEDIAIEALEEVVDYVDVVESSEQLKLIGIGIARNKAVDLLRSRLSERRGGGKTLSLESLEESGGAGQIASTDAPLTHIDAMELAQALGNLLRGLSQQERGILSDFFLAGLSYREISENRKIAVGSVGATKDRACEKLRKILARNPGLLKELEELLR